MGIFSFGKKDDAPSRRDAEAGPRRRSSQNTRVERRSRRPARSGDAEAMLLDPTLPEKQRARRRLVGAIALVLAAIVILPMVLDSHPKTVTNDISVDIPSRPVSKTAARGDEDTQAGVAPDNPAAALGVATPGATAASGAAPAQTARSAQATQTTQAKPAAPAKSAPAAQVQAQANQSKVEAAKPASGAALASRGKSAGTTAATNAATNAATTAANAENDAGAPAAPPGARFAVQLGAFGSDAAANKWVTKLKTAGVPAYTEQHKEADGTTRTLLRAGPFPDRASATEAIAKVRGAGLMAGSNGSAQ
ncbi:SPOR domain-containing protein [Paraburkholderia tagetis]|uniref:SPOR domain-containing protein n=1 Tax=Paraburkholderia tagetis TaxID=2913261 RepID=A0A9X1RQZ8_9BURK|nr:SPOR domain-containing protein [Paraburkholderia tagetis]MCG5074759.1 SPOR domain-containing protein [Paraburkholderia tagetis]